ncbi:MAG: hypothetical protein KA436_00135 [Oligoflexales bacterium]|nr:hypothetical protein [Oligoflexales bacterium]
MDLLVWALFLQLSFAMLPRIDAGLRPAVTRAQPPAPSGRLSGAGRMSGAGGPAVAFATDSMPVCSPGAEATLEDGRDIPPDPTALVSSANPADPVDDDGEDRGTVTTGSQVDATIRDVRMSLYQFRAFLNLLSSAVVVATKGGKIAVVNDAASALFKYPVGILEGDQRLIRLSRCERSGMFVTSLMPREIAHIHHLLMERRIQSGEQRIGKAPRKVVIKVRQDPDVPISKMKDIPEPIRLLGERIHLRSDYANEQFMRVSSFQEEEGYAFREAMMTLGEIRIAEESYFIAFFDTSSLAAALSARRASFASKLAADAVGDRGMATALMSSSLDSARGSREVASLRPRKADGSVIFVDIVGSTVAMCGRDPDEVFGDLNQLYEKFDQVVLSTPSALKIKVTGDGYIVGVGLSEGASASSFAESASTAVEMGRRFLEIAKVQNLCGRPVELRVGIHSGPIMIGILGTTKKTMDILGSTVSVAARMESKGLRGQIQLSGEVHRHLAPSLKALFRVRHDHGVRQEEFNGEVFISSFPSDR